jgi:hypothetical protein
MSSTVFPIIMTVLIAALLIFWLFFPTAWVAASLNAMGAFFQGIWAFIQKIFGKKPKAPPPAAEILPVDPPSNQDTPKDA